MASEINRARVPPSVTRSPSAAPAEPPSAPAKAPVTAQSSRPADGFVADPASRGSTRSTTVDNNFRRVITGAHPAPTVGGFFEQLKQANETRKLQSYASLSYLSGGAHPPDTAVSAKLRSLQLTPIVPGPKSVADYTSTVPGTSAQKLYEKFVSNPQALFGASGDFRLRPADLKQLSQGARIMIEDKGPPPLWMPVQVRLDPAKREIEFQTLDGHPMRGTNTFRFSDDGQGGARIEQHSVFQLSSLVASIGNGVFDGSDRQHKTWEASHAYLFRSLANSGTGE